MFLARAALSASSYAVLVDILLATMGIFIVVFTQLQLEDTPELVPLEVDGLAICETAEQIELYDHVDGKERKRNVDVSEFSDLVREAWPSGARIFVLISQDCAYSSWSPEFWRIESDIRRLDEVGANYLLEIVPVKSEGETIGSIAETLKKWRATHHSGEMSR